MNKKQWFTLGVFFIIVDIAFSIKFLIPIRTFASQWSLLATMSGASGEALIAANIQDAMYTSLSWICYIISFIFGITVIVCIICGWLEKEEAR